MPCMQMQRSLVSKRDCKMERESDNQGLSFTIFDFEDDQKLRLIDISQEDDDLLIDSPFLNSLEDLRLSDAHAGLTLLEPQASQNVENTGPEQKLSPSRALMPAARPSYMRKSLAWDTAFFTNAGVLDMDELTFINKGFETAEIMQLPSVTTSRKINVGSQNRTNKSASERENRNVQRSLKNKTQRVSKKEEFHLLALKASKVSSRMMNLLPGKSRSASVDTYHSKMENRSTTVGSVSNLKLRKKSALEDACRCRLSSGSPSSPEFVSSLFASSTKDSTISRASNCTTSTASSTKFPSALLKRKTDSRKGNLSVSTSTSDAAVRYLGEGKGLGQPRFSTQSLSLSNNFACMSPGTSSVGSCSGLRSQPAKQQSHGMEVYPDTSVTLRRNTSSSNDGINSPCLTSNLQKVETMSPVLTTQCTPDTFIVPAESRKKLKPSYLRMPSPKIGFFDQEKSVMPTMRESLQFQFEMQCTTPGKNGPTNRKTPGKLPRAGISPGKKSLNQGSRSTRPVRLDGKLKSSSPKVWSTMKIGSDLDLRFQSGTLGEAGEGVCSKCRKIGAGELDKKRVRQISVLRQEDEERVKGRPKSRLSRETEEQKDDSTIPKELANPVEKEQRNASNLHSGDEDWTRSSANFEDQVNDLSRYFDVIDLARDVQTEHEDQKKYNHGTDNCEQNHVDNTISSFTGENVAYNQHQEVPKIFTDLSPSLSEFSPKPRTPLGDKTPISNNRSGSLMQSTKEKSSYKSSAFPCSDKENSLPHGA